MYAYLLRPCQENRMVAGTQMHLHERLSACPWRRIGWLEQEGLPQLLAQLCCFLSQAQPARWVVQRLASPALTWYVLWLVQFLRPLQLSGAEVQLEQRVVWTGLGAGC